MDLFNITSDSLFPLNSSQNAQREQFAGQSLVRGLDAYSNGDYRAAVQNFRQAVAYAPQSESALNAYDYQARAHYALGETAAAVDAYKALLKAVPGRDDIRLALASIYMNEGRTDEAHREYEEAVRINPTPANRFSLGNSYLAQGLVGQAHTQFEIVRRETPTEPYGNFGLGLAYAKEGRFDAAIQKFQDAIGQRPDYWQAYAEMGYAYVDSGDTESAQEVLSTLTANSTKDAVFLAAYMNEKSKPRITGVYPSAAFEYFPFALSAGTKLADISQYLKQPGDETVLSLSVSFSKSMDRIEVENVLNWSITRAMGTGQGDGYNYAMTLPETETELDTHPFAVYYDNTEQTATILLKVRQNSTGTGTIDPMHLDFSFQGKDTFGLTMDPEADKYSGYSGIA